ncbi:MAG: hypothetical protein EX270_08765 [Pseudomonadales bacterium]|nr:MAG: hypothetical protein EX270_08765 [Pseudomonadales bacterium]
MNDHRALPQAMQLARIEFYRSIARIALRQKKFCCAFDTAAELTNFIDFPFPALAELFDNGIFFGDDPARLQVEGIEFFFHGL